MERPKRKAFNLQMEGLDTLIFKNFIVTEMRFVLDE